MGMMGYGFGGVGMILGMVMQIALVVLVVISAIWLFRTWPSRGTNGPEAMSILQQRYAKGEIGDDEYQRMKKELA